MSVHLYDRSSCLTLVFVPQLAWKEGWRWSKELEGGIFGSWLGHCALDFTVIF